MGTWGPLIDFCTPNHSYLLNTAFSHPQKSLQPPGSGSFLRLHTGCASFLNSIVFLKKRREGKRSC